MPTGNSPIEPFGLDIELVERPTILDLELVDLTGDFINFAHILFLFGRRREELLVPPR
jgi:hypothetical protein